MKSDFRKFMALLMALLLILASFGCSSGSDKGDEKDDDKKTSTSWNFASRDTISIGYNHIVALKSDGTVVAVGDNEDGQCNVSGWTDIKLP